MRISKTLFAAVAAVSMTFAAQAERIAKVAFGDGGATMYFAYDDGEYGVKGSDWYPLAESQAQSPDNDPPWYFQRRYVTKVVFDQTFADYSPSHCGNWFCGFDKLAVIQGMDNLDTSSVASMRNMFSGCSSLTSLDLSGFNTAKVMDMQSMFSGCSSLTSLDLTGFDTSNVTDMYWMFNGCSALKKIVASDAFVTGQVTGSGSMFSSCTSLIGGNGTVYDSTKVDKAYARVDKSGVPGYFTAALPMSAKVLVENGGKTLRFVYDNRNHGAEGSEWFSVAEAEAIADPTEETVPWYDLRSAVERVVFAESFAAYQPKSVANWFFDFNELTAVEGLAYLDTSKVTSFYCLFNGCLSLTSLDVSGFDTSNATDLGGMFGDCSLLESLNVSGFVTSKATDMSAMFSGCWSLASLDVSGFDASNVENMSYMFYDCSLLTSLNVSRFRTSKVTDMYCMFGGCSSLTSLDLSGFNTAKVTDMGCMFVNSSALKTIVVSDAFVTTAVRDSADMFEGCVALKGGNGTVYDSTKVDKAYARIDVAGRPGYFTGSAKVAKAVLEDGGTTLRFVYDNLNHGVKDVDWFSVKEAEAIGSSGDMPWFANSANVLKVVFDPSFAAYRPARCCGWFCDLNMREIEGIENLDTSSVEDMSEMFLGCEELLSLDLSHFNTAKVTDMSEMFNGCVQLKSLDLRGFNTERVTNMRGMFLFCCSLKSLDLTSFNTSRVTDMAGMFAACFKLEKIIVTDAFVADGATDVADGIFMFSHCDALVGGNGTAFDSTKVNRAYARIDKPGQPGYFTAGSAPGPNPGDDDPDGPGPKPIPTLFNSVMPAAVTLTKTATYNGFLGEQSLGGTFTLAVKKPARGTTTGKATLTKIDPTTGKKVKTTGTVNLATGKGEGELAGLVLNAKGLGGTFAGFKVQGALDAGKAKDAATIDYLNTYNKTAYAFVLEDSVGERAMLTATFSKKGKVKISGTVAGKKISGSAYMSVGDRCAVPFVYAKKSAAISFVLWFDKATKRLTDVSGFGAGVKVVACGLAEPPALGAYKVALAKADVLAAVPDAIGATPLTVTTSFTGKKFDAGKSAKVSFRKGVLTVDTSRGANVSGLALKYSRGALSGSFTVYAIDPVRGRLVKNKFTVSGLVIDGVGYAVGINKKLPSIPLKLGK